MNSQNKPTPVDAPIHDILQKRWSSVCFDSTPIDATTIKSLFEAARWAPSCYGDQPWVYVYAAKGDVMRDTIEGMLSEGNAWAKNAGLLIVGFARKTLRKNGKPNDYRLYDLGAASLQLVLEATTHGLCSHQMAGFSKDKVSALLGVPDDYEPGAMIAIGHPGDPTKLSEALLAREKSPRSRNPQESFAFRGKWSETK